MDKDRIRQKLKETPLITGLTLYNTNPSIWTVPKKGSYGYTKLMNLIPSKKPKKDSYSDERVARIIREAEDKVGMGFI